VSTYTDGHLEEAAQWADKKLHADLFHFGTVTGRLSCSNPNLQNQPARGTWATKIRECFIPDPGMMFTAADYSQVELRYFADYCGGTLLEAFLRGEDLHEMTATALKTSRQQAKTVNFGFLLYGGGPDKLAKELGLSSDQAQEKIKDLHAQYPEVDAWRSKVIEAVGGVVEWSGTGENKIVGGRGPIPWAKTRAGRVREFPELNPDLLRDTDPAEYLRLMNKYKGKCKQRGKKPTTIGAWMSIRSRGERLLVNYLVQGGSRDLLVDGMTYYAKHAPPRFDIIMTVHDEVLTQHPIGAEGEAASLLKTSLEQAGSTLGLRVPIVAEPKSGYTWAETK
jgi:DNA polymerase-1